MAIVELAAASTYRYIGGGVLSNKGGVLNNLGGVLNNTPMLMVSFFMGGHSTAKVGYHKLTPRYRVARAT